jgi:hypothetical protein
MNSFILKRFICVNICTLLICGGISAQKSNNFDFETLDPASGLPVGINSFQKDSYLLSIDSLIRQHGKYSVVLEQKNRNAEFGAFSFRIKPAFSGKKLTLKGYIRTENVSEGFAGLWMRVDGNGEVLSFDNMQSQGLKGTNDWKEYKIEVEFDEEEASDIYVGGLLVGKGKVWLDNFHLLVDDKDFSLAPVSKKVQKKADLDTFFMHGSLVQFGELNSMKIDNLANLGMIWGFLKYYHPAIENGQFNWDAELFRILPKVIGATSKATFNEALESWVDSLGKPELCNKCIKLPKSDSLIKELPDYGLIFLKNNLVDSLAAKLQYIKDNRHQGKGYYIDKVPGVGNPVFRNENPYYGILYPDAGYRLLSLFRYWNMIQYFYPNKYLIGEDWNQVLPEFIPKFIGANDSTQYMLACLELIARIHDRHANIWRGNGVLENYRGKYRIPVQAKMIEINSWLLATTRIVWVSEIK